MYYTYTDNIWFCFEILHKIELNCMYPFANFSLSIVFHVSACRSNLFNHLIFKPLSSIALFTCPVKKYPSFNHMFHENFPDFFFLQQTNPHFWISPSFYPYPSGSSCIFLYLCLFVPLACHFDYTVSSSTPGKCLWSLYVSWGLPQQLTH